MPKLALCVLLCSAALLHLVESGGHGGGHQHVIIHVPYKIKTIKHTHTITKHIHHKDDGDKYEVLGYTVGHPIDLGGHGGHDLGGHDWSGGGGGHGWSGGGGGGGHDWSGGGGGGHDWSGGGMSESIKGYEGSFDGGHGGSYEAGGGELGGHEFSGGFSGGHEEYGGH